MTKKPGDRIAITMTRSKWTKVLSGLTRDAVANELTEEERAVIEAALEKPPRVRRRPRVGFGFLDLQTKPSNS